jgi:protein-serine/threonine kinase
VSEGLYVGSAVDIWSCGVILYAMLSGYLPYDDDPDNPEGDNINLLYKYIMSTSLKFPDHLSALAKDLLQIMLVPEPEYRCSINEIMGHPWLYSQRDVFERTIEMNEYVFQENMYRKSQQAKRDLQERRRVQQDAKAAKVAIQRSQSSMPGSSVTASMLDARRAQRHHSALPTTTTMPEFLANAGRAPPLGQPAPSAPAPAQTSPVFARAAIVPAASVPLPRDTPTPETWEIVTPPRIDTSAVSDVRAPSPPSPPSPSSPAYKPSFEWAASAAAVENDPQVEATVEGPTMQQNKNRHTIQVEYDGEAAYEKMNQVYGARDEDANANPRPSKKRTLHVPQATTSDIEMASGSESGHARASTMESLALDATTPEASQILTPEETTVSLPPGAAPAKPVSAESQADTPLTPRASNSAIREDILATPRAQVTPTATPKASLRAQGKRFDSMPPPAVPPPKAVPELAEPPRSAGLTPLGLPKVPPPKRDRARKGMSLDKFGLAKLLGQTPASSSVDVSRPPPSAGVAAAALQEAQARPGQSMESQRTSMIRPRTAESENKDKKSSRRRTLQLITSR